MILLIDNYDSFTYNLVQRLYELDAALDIRVVRNDAMTASEALALAPSHVIVSPGPCTPTEAGHSPAIMSACAGHIPTLGVCLGHQCIGSEYGMKVVRAPEPIHGKVYPVFHTGTGVFSDLPNPFDATRYHSLVIEEASIDLSRFEITAWTPETAADGSERRIVQGIRKLPDSASEAPLEGVQFHPESFLTTHGTELLSNFLNY